MELKMKEQDNIISTLVSNFIKNYNLDNLKKSEQGMEFVNSLLTFAFNSIMKLERDIYLNKHHDDVANGFFNRTLTTANQKISLNVPRTRNSNFFPSLIQKYSRVIPSEYSNIVESLLLSCASIEKLKSAISMLNLPFSPEEIDKITTGLEKEFHHYVNRELSADFLIISVDVKILNVKYGDTVKKSSLYTAIGVDMDAKKEVIASKLYKGNESLEHWKNFLISIKNRGLARCLLFITDNFKGLTTLIKNLFPSSFHQLCLFHLIKNAKYNLPKDSYKYFKEQLDLICNSKSFDDAYNSFLKLIDYVKQHNKNFASSLEKFHENYLTLTNFPQEIRKRIKSTNMSENLHKELEKIRLNTGGFFQSEKILSVKWYIFIKNLTKSQWKFPDPLFKHFIFTLHSIFYQKFEA